MNPAFLLYVEVIQTRINHTPMIRSINAFDQSLLAEFPLMTDHDVAARLSKASLAFQSWRRTSFAQRQAYLLRVAEWLRAHQEECARVISLEMGKVISESRAEVEKCALGCTFYAQHAEAFLADDIIDTPGRQSKVAYQPTGVILAVMPWNFPLWQVFRFAAPALMAGNVALLKHASNVIQCAVLIEKIFREAGLPDGVFQTLVIENHQIESILAADAVQGVALTGSEGAGSAVASIAGKYIKKSVLELGGSDPFVVLPDADLDKTIPIAIQSRMQNAGQSCIAAKRFIVVQDIYDDFLERFQTGIAALRQGNPFADGITTGPMARVDLAETLEQQCAASVAKGARLLTGGQRMGSNFQPALLDRVKPGMPAFDEETFGPLAAVIVAQDEYEAIALANHSRYGLGASVWTRDLERGERVAREIEAGSVFVNALMRSEPALPFGGVKKSGYGRELSKLGIHEFVNAKTISMAP